MVPHRSVKGNSDSGDRQRREGTPHDVLSSAALLWVSCFPERSQAQDLRALGTASGMLPLSQQLIIHCREQCNESKAKARPMCSSLPAMAGP